MSMKYFNARNVIGTVVVLLSCATISIAQEGPDPAQVSAMKKLDFLTGKWKGSGWIFVRGGKRRTFGEMENIGWKAGGLVMTIDGKGKARNPSKGKERSVHNAFTVVSYDRAGGYRWGAFLSTGQSTVAHGHLESANTFVWEMEIPQMGTMRYTIKINGNKWDETAARSTNGKKWIPFFGMALTRQ